ncbi:MAG: Rossmann fold domain-containing protein [Novosphingobium sp.]
MALFRVGVLSDDPLAAAAAWHAEVLPRIFQALDDGEAVLTLVFEPAPHKHRDWRKAAVASLAREKAPARINAVASDEALAITAAVHYLEAAKAITGHYMPLNGQGAALVVS